MKRTKRHNKKRFLKILRSSSRKGFLLPMVIILGLAVGTVSVVGLQSVSQNSATLNSQNYQVIAREAAKAGLASAITCLNKNTTDWTSALVNTNCTGGGAATAVATGDGYVSNFSVAIPDRTTYTSSSSTRILITSTGKVTLKGPDGTTTVSSVQQTIKSLLQVESAPTPPTGTPTGQTSKDIDEISTGPSTACVVAEGGAYCWGSNEYLQLGNGVNMRDDRSLSAVAVYNKQSQAAIPGQSFQSCFLFVCSTTWNPANSPALGESPLYNKRVTKVSVGTTHACAIATDTSGNNGRVYCWGKNDQGQLGNDSTSDSSIPVAVDATAARATVPATGCGFFGCATPEIPGKAASALQNKNVVEVSAGNGFTCARASDNEIACWGNNSSGQLGTESRSDSRVPVAVNKDAAQVGRARQCVSWVFFVCTGYDIPESIPAKPASGLYNKTIKSLGRVKGASTMCVTTTDGKVVCWGANSTGQAGNNTHAATNTAEGACPSTSVSPGVSNSNDVLRPVTAISTQSFESVTTLGSYTTAKTDSSSASPNRMFYWGGTSTVSSETRVKCGDTNSGGSNAGAGTNKYAARASRSYTSIPPTGPLYDGTTGLLDKKQLLLEAGNAYNGLFCAVTGSDVYCDAHGAAAKEGQLGNGYYCTSSSCAGQTGAKAVSRDRTLSWLNPDRNITQLDSGSGYTCVVADKGVACWGLNSSGQLGTKDTINRPYPTGIDTEQATSALYGTTNTSGSGTGTGTGSGTSPSTGTGGGGGAISVLLNF